jgi:hypothetical protein
MLAAGAFAWLPPARAPLTFEIAKAPDLRSIDAQALGSWAAWTYGLRVRTIRASLTISALSSGLAEMPVRNPQIRLSLTEHRRIHQHATCGFPMGCGLRMRRLKKKGPKKGPGKGPTRQSDNDRCRFAARNLLQRNDFRVGLLRFG